MPEQLNSVSNEAHNTPDSGWMKHRHHPIAICLMAVLLVVLLALTAYRISRNYSEPASEFNWTSRGFSDFHNGTYFPGRAFVSGRSPYSTEVAKEIGVARAAPPYSPVVFMIHAPFALQPLEVSRVLFFFYNFAVIAGLAFCILRMSLQPFRWFDFLAITNLLLVSRPGHITMFTGYFTAQIVLGCIVALHFSKTRPAISGWGLVLASIKPNFLIPLALLMVFRRDFKALIFGGVFCVITAGAGLAWLSYHNGFEQVIADVRGGQESLHVDPTEMPINTWTRVDIVGMYAKVVDWVPGDGVYLLTMLVCVSVVGFFLWRISKTETNVGATGVSATIVILTTLLSIYHHAYDCLLLAVPAISLLFFGHETVKEVSPKFRWIVGSLVSVPAVNYLSTKSIMDAASLEPLSIGWQAVTMINGVSMLIALIILVVAALRDK